MNQPHTKQVLAEDIKREVLMELNQSTLREQSFVDNIKNQVMAELGQPPYVQTSAPNGALAEAVKQEVLADLQYRRQRPVTYSGSPYQLNRGEIESIKREVIAQITQGRETQGEAREPEHEKMQQQDPGESNQHLIQAVKDSVIAEMGLHNYR
ncbi:MAG: hypothetical protein GX352_01840 [Clostridiales bacterium]|nr:hypothetical protein [Clostridiales bacterium]